VFVTLSVVGAILLLWFTNKGIGLWEDSFDYITSALTLAETGQLGRVDALGAFRPLTHFPPGYPATLALLDLFGVDVYIGARWLSSLLFGLTVGLLGITGFLLTGSIAWGIVASVLTITSEVVIGVHLWALSEPLYIFLSVLALVLVAAYLRSPRRMALLWAASLVTGLALLTRFVGVSVIGAGAVALVASPNAPLRKRATNAALFGIAGFVPLAAFLLRNFLISGNPADLSTPAWHFPSEAQWQEAARTLLNWALPDFVVESLGGDESLVAVAVIIGMGVIALALSTRLRFRPPPAGSGGWPGLMLIHITCGVAYALTVLMTVAVVHRITPLDDRILSPLYPTVVVVGIAVMAQLWSGGGTRAKAVVLAVCVLFAAFQVARFRGLLRTLPADSRGFASEAWRASETIAYVRALPPTLLYSNEIQALYFLTGRNAVFIPTRLNPATGEPREDYELSLARMRERLISEVGALVLIDPSELSSEEMNELVDGLALEAELSDGVVYRPPDPDG
jgi:hypothetical protein